jgi:putative glycosyltransferase
MDLSVVTTLYRSSPYIEEFHRRMSAAARQITSDYELIFVDDGSPDNSLEVALSLYARDPHIRVVELSRNFGHHRAIVAGLEHVRGELVFLLDCDLEEAPELLQQFYTDMHAAAGTDVVYGVQRSRKGGWFEKMSGNLFYWIFNLLSNYPVPPNQVTARLMKRRYVTALAQHRDREICLVGLMAITGFHQVATPVEKGHKGATTYSLLKRANLFVNAITSFSNRPLVVIFYIGSAVVSVSAISGVALIVRDLIAGPFLAGWASLMVSLWFLGGLMIFCIGVVGVYLSRVFMETKERPHTIIRHLHQDAPGAVRDEREQTTASSVGKR